MLYHSSTKKNYNKCEICINKKFLEFPLILLLVGLFKIKCKIIQMENLLKNNCTKLLAEHFIKNFKTIASKINFEIIDA